MNDRSAPIVESELTIAESEKHLFQHLRSNRKFLFVDFMASMGGA